MTLGNSPSSMSCHTELKKSCASCGFECVCMMVMCLFEKTTDSQRHIIQIEFNGTNFLPYLIIVDKIAGFRFSSHPKHICLERFAKTSSIYKALWRPMSREPHSGSQGSSVPSGVQTQSPAEHLKLDFSKTNQINVFWHHVKNAGGVKRFSASIRVLLSSFLPVGFLIGSLQQLMMINYAIAIAALSGCCKISRSFFSRWEAKPKPIAPGARDFSCALSKLQEIGRNSDCFIALCCLLLLWLDGVITLVLVFWLSFEIRSNDGKKSQSWSREGGHIWNLLIKSLTKRFEPVYKFTCFRLWRPFLPTGNVAC